QHGRPEREDGPALPRPEGDPHQGGRGHRIGARPLLPPGWNKPWWNPAIGLPLYVFAGLLLVAGLFEGTLTTCFRALELLGLGLLAADAWCVRQHIPVLSSPDKAVAAGGWVLLVLAAIGLALTLPIL